MLRQTRLVTNRSRSGCLGQSLTEVGLEGNVWPEDHCSTHCFPGTLDHRNSLPYCSLQCGITLTARGRREFPDYGESADVGFTAFYAICLAFTWFVYIPKTPNQLTGV